MKTKPHFIALLMLAALFASCQSTRVQKDAKTEALITAAKDNNAAEARRLIADGADVNAKGNEDWTSLMWAAWYNSPEVAKILLESGADVSAKDNDGKTALMIATEKEATDIAELLEAAGARR
ncbi:MAG: ankyrin repeat domain-containing protein [Treponema sp.]|nr:ankyrin repeat domain-containing protein [Treponema sp.]